MNVSVIMSVFNAQNTLSKSIESILNQSFKNLEFLICDDGSSDHSLEILKKYEKKDQRIQIFQNKINLGLTKSLNKLLKISTGELIARQDADDISFENRFTKQINCFKNNKVNFVTTRAISQQTGKKIPRYSTYIPTNLIMNFKNPFIHGTLMIEKKVISEINYYDEKFVYAQDYKLFSDLLKENYRYKIIRQPLYILNMSNNISTNKHKEQKYYANCVKRNLSPDV